MAYTQDEKSTGLDTLSTLASGDLVIVGDASDSGRAKVIAQSDFNAVGEKLDLSASTTNDVSTTKHGFAPTLPNDATKYLDGTGNYTTPSTTAPINASITVKGVVQEATQSEVNAGTATGSTGARLFINPSTLAAAILSIINTAIATYKNLFLSYTVNADEATFGWNTVQLRLPWAGSDTPWVDTAGLVFFPDGVLQTGSAVSALHSILMGPLVTTGGLAFSNTKKYRIKISAGLASAANTNYVLGLTDIPTTNGVTEDPMDVTQNSIRFVRTPTTLYGCTSNGAAVTATIISTPPTLTDENIYEIVWIPGVNVEFWVNGVLGATNTTNIPTSGARANFTYFGRASSGSPTVGYNLRNPVISREI